ncbi:MAG: triose-phosphate isomerase [Nanoarchaeota archaeon]
MLVINFKNYKVGKDVIELLRKIEIYHNKAIVAVPFVELKEVVKGISSQNMQVYAQHVDYHDLGRATGYVIPESLINAGAKGALLNHSEHRLNMIEIKKTVKRCNEVGLKLIICSSSLREISQLKKLNPYAIAFEDKKLIATGKSITEYKQHDITRFVDILKDTNIIPLCGAGISSGDDVANALVLGCKGALVSSVVANSQTPEKFLKEVHGVF